MTNKLKILIVRFSSLGDIILTTPVIRCLKDQLNSDVHFITKFDYKHALENNPYLDKIYFFNESISEIISELRLEKYNYIIDLHNNLRSWGLRRLGVNARSYDKYRIYRWMLLRFGIDFLPRDHVVDRYMKTVSFLGVVNDNKGLDYFFSKELNVDFNVNQQFITWSIGSSYEQKKLSNRQIIDVCSRISLPVVLLGEEKDKVSAQHIIGSSKQNMYDFCGASLNESSYLVKNSVLTLTNDSAIMHIASAFNVPIISFWGCTKPILGFRPYMAHDNSIEIISNRSNNRPCSKHGKSCRFILKGCIKEIESERIYNAIMKII